MSIRMRLTLLYTTILALTLTSFGGMLYVTQSQSMLAASRRLTAGAARRIVDRFQDVGSLYGRQFPPSPPGDDNPSQDLRDRIIYAQLLSPDGDVVDRTESLGEAALPLSDAGLRSARNGESWEEIALVEGERFLILSEPVTEEDGLVTEIVQVAHPLADQDEYLGALRRNLSIEAGIATLAAFGIGWILSSLALRPIHGITRTARAIGAERDLTRRVQYAGPDDEIGQLATTFNAMLTELQVAYLQQQFVADVSHELRTPLTTIRGNLGLLRREPAIRAEIEADVLDDLLSLARAESRQPLQTRQVQVKPLVEDVCRQARLLDPGRSITCAPQANVAVAGDQDALKQVLLILVDNALRHTTGAIAVMIAAPDERVKISVRDKGPGIDPAALPQIFERFYRGGEASHNSGLGLGLPIAKALVEAQSGTIVVESHEGQGTTATISLPRY